MKRTGQNGIKALAAIGFTALEAEVYTALLAQPPTTGYRIAQVLAKPAANVYKALEALESKGAVLVDEGESRLCRAVPPEELLARLGRSFKQRCDEAAAALTELNDDSDDDRVYQMRSHGQVMERCRQMLDRSKEVALLDVFPGPLEELRPDIEAAAARGVGVGIKVYAPAEIAGAEVILTPEGARVIERWPGQWVNVVIDGEEHLLALLSSDGEGVHQAVWSGSAYLSWVYQSAASSELILAAVNAQLARGADADALRRQLARYEWLKATEAPGYKVLLSRFGGQSRNED